jgi:probable phosphoglycerate mutase
MGATEKIYFVRHGQTDANLSNLAAGAGWDIPLNDTGLAQARTLAEGEKIALCHDVATICVSPMTRAVQTAEAINQVLKKPLVIIDDLKEWHLGDWEKTSWLELPNLFSPDAHPPNGESQREFGMRIAKALTVARSHSGPIMIVAHGGVWHCIARLLSLPKGSIENCDLKCLVKDDGEIWRLD